MYLSVILHNQIRSKNPHQEQKTRLFRWEAGFLIKSRSELSFVPTISFGIPRHVRPLSHTLWQISQSENKPYC